MKQSFQLLVGTLMLLITFSASAQVEVNPKTGFNISILNAKTEYFNSGATVGWNAGVDFQIGKGKFTMNPGLHYYNNVGMFFHDLEEQFGLPSDPGMKIQSLRIPLNAGFNLGKKRSNFGLQLKAGLTPSFIVSQEQIPLLDFILSIDAEFSIESGSSSEVLIKEINSPSINRFSLGTNFGLVFKWWIFTSEINYELGLTNFFKNSKGKNHLLTFSTGIRF